MSLNKYHLNIKNYPQFSLGVDTINCNSMTVENKTLPTPSVNLFQKNILSVVSSSHPVSDLSDLNFSQDELDLNTTCIYFRLNNFDLVNQTFDIILSSFIAGKDLSNAVVTGVISDTVQNLNYLFFPKFIIRSTNNLEINFIQSQPRPAGNTTDLLGNLIVRY